MVRDISEKNKGPLLTNSKPESFLNPHLQCNGECYVCEDNIPPHNDVPNLCGRKSKEPTEDFIKVESKPYWLIPKDVDDFLRNYPSDGVRIKYDKLLESLPEKADLEKLIDFQVPDKFRREMEEKYLEGAKK